MLLSNLKNKTLQLNSKYNISTKTKYKNVVVFSFHKSHLVLHSYFPMAETVAYFVTQL